MTSPLSPLKIIYMGSPDFSVPALDALIDAGHEIICVYAQPPRPAGRGHKVRLCPVHAHAESLGLNVRTPEHFKDSEEQEYFASLNADIAVVAAYGLILPPAVLEAPRLGCLNIHASLLPRWRGAAPIQRAILAGDEESGVSIMQMDAGLDTGDILMTGVLPLEETTTASMLHDALAQIGAEMIVETLEELLGEGINPEPQLEDEVTYAHKLTSEEGQLDWTFSAEQLGRVVRALNPWPGVWFDYQGVRLKVKQAEWFEQNSDELPGTVLDNQLTIKCGSGKNGGTFRLTKIQRPGKGAMDSDAFLRGFEIPAGSILD